ncbi:predicted protein [Naegleria gruberi]|uniref:Predicted protein n=1 Tax=Naegleria gruberi TaxID=5762 RepID=D2VLE3_NAEGR|nr:uncharacterized protein NAEGRDRAFT_50512 [Naegleria gruberi]EFC42372.1 predicted protein [Naegleria gruberi]|eukprot:XP_002675116.1 predicted protein [Naegleria gruberi strain NEG-M]
MSNTSPSLLLYEENNVFNASSDETNLDETVDVSTSSNTANSTIITTSITTNTNTDETTTSNQNQQPKKQKTRKPQENEYSELSGYEWKHLFLYSCTNGDLLLFKQLIDVLDKKLGNSHEQDFNNKDFNFFDINVRDERRATALHKACAYGHICITRELLLRSDVDKYCVDASLATPFHYAAASGNVLVVNLLFSQAKESLDSRDIFGNTPLLLAMQNGRLEVVRFLLGILPTNSIRTKKSTNSRSLLHLAASNYDIEGMKLLLLERNELIKERNKKKSKTEEVDESDHDLDELMYRECLQDMCCTSMSPEQETSSILTGDTSNMELRLSAHGKVLIQAKEENGLTPLMLAIKEYRSTVSKTPAEKQVCLMYLLMAEISSQNSSGSNHAPIDSMKRTTLHIAAVHDCADFFRLIALMFDTEFYMEQLMMKDNTGLTPLHLACKQGSINVVETIILMCSNAIPQKEQNKITSPPSPLTSISCATTTTSIPITIKQPRNGDSYNSILIKSPPSSPSFNTPIIQIQNLIPNTPTSLKVLNSADTKNRPPIFYAAFALAKHCKKEAKEMPVQSLDSANQSSTSTSSIHILGVRGEKDTFQKIIFNLISTGLVSLHPLPNSPHSTPASPSKNSNTTNPPTTPSSTFDLLCNETDYFEKFPQHFRVCSPTGNKSKRNFDDFYSNPLHSPSQIHTRTARSMSSSGFSLRKSFGLFQSSSLAEDVDVRPPTSPSKRNLQ